MSIDPKKFGLSDSLVNAVNEALKGGQKNLDKAPPFGKLTGDDFKKLRGEGSKPDFLDLDKDGNKKEPMKGAAKQAAEEVENVDEVSSAMLYRAKQAAQKKASWLMPGDKGKGDKAWNRVKKFRDAGVAKEKQERSIKKEEVEALDELKGNKSGLTKLAYLGKAGKVIRKTDPKDIANDPDTERKFKNRMTGLKNLLKRTQKEEIELDEKAVSQAQQKAAGAALATQRGEYDGGKKGGAVNRMALMKASELRKIAATKRKGLPMSKEEVDEAVAGTNVAADMAARKTDVQRRIAQKQASMQLAKSNRRISGSTMKEASCTCGEAKESKMTCEMHGDKKTLKGGKEPILMNPPLKEAVVSGNEGQGYHGNVEAGSHEERGKKYAVMHTKVKKLVGSAGHLKDARQPNTMVKHFLDSSHGRHIADEPSDRNITNRFSVFKKGYKPEMHK